MKQLTNEEILELEAHIKANNLQPMKQKYFATQCDCKLQVKLKELLNYNKNGTKK
jgi:hypothetical protein